MPSIEFTLTNHVPANSIQQKRKIQKWLREVITAEGFTAGKVSVILMSDSELFELNQTYLNHHTYTDIITFDYSSKEEVSGDLCISYDRVKENAIVFNCSVKDELHRVMVHGVLHLCRYSDKTPSAKSQMTDKEDYYLTLRDF